MLIEALAVEGQAREGRGDVRITEQPDVEEEDRPEPGRLDDDERANTQGPGGNDHDEREVELRISQPGKRRRNRDR